MKKEIDPVTKKEDIFRCIVKQPTEVKPKSVTYRQITQNQKDKLPHIISEQHQFRDFCQTKYHIKNKYKQKLKNIAPQMSNQKGRKNSHLSLFSHLSSNFNNSIQESEQKKMNRRQKNKIAAKQSRDRKKTYIQILQKQIKDIENNINQTTNQIEYIRNQVNRQTQQTLSISQFTSGRLHIYKKLQKILRSTKQIQQDRDQEINLALDSISFRMGAAGKDRKNSINQYSKQIINLTFPSIHRYILWSAMQQQHLFANSSDQNKSRQYSWFKQIQDIFVFNEKQRSVLKNLRDPLMKQRLSLLQSLNKFNLIKQDMQKVEVNFDDIILNVRQILTPVQAANLIMILDKYKFRKQISENFQYIQRRYSQDNSLKDSKNSQIIFQSKPYKKMKLQ